MILRQAEPQVLPVIMQRALLIIFLTPLLVSWSASAQEYPRQKVHRSDFQPVSDEVFDVISQFYDYDRTYPLAPRVIESEDEGGVHTEKVVFTTQNGERVPGELAIPDSRAGAGPAVILVHGLGSSKERWRREDRSSLRDSLLAAGISVFAIDLRFHGERSVANDYQNPVFLTFGDSLFIRSRDMGIQSTIDVRRAIDYLSTRPEIDANRIAVVGYSMGGMIAIRLAALEPRLAAVVACAIPTTKQPLPTDPFQFAPRANVRVHLLIGSDDWLSSPTDARTLQAMLPEDSQLTFFDSGHVLPPEFAEQAARWLIEQL